MKTIIPNTKRGFGSAGIIIIILLVLGVGAYFWESKSISNFCLTQDSNGKAEETISKVINQFEVFQGKKSLQLLSTCVSKSLADGLAVKADLFPFYTIIGYSISDTSKISDEKYTARVSERRLLFKSGISGGSYPEETKTVSFTLEKSDGRWSVTSYGGMNQLPVITDVPLNDISDWKIYRDEKYSLEFKYPYDWNVTKTDYDDITKGFWALELKPIIGLQK